MQELPFLRSARRLMLIDICMKFREDSFRGFQVTQRTRFVMDRRTDERTDRRPGKNNMSPNPSGIFEYKLLLAPPFCNFLSQTAWPIKAKFHVEPPWEGGTKFYINGPGHMNKMAAIPIYGKNL